MVKTMLVFLALSTRAFSLVPLEGLVKGDVREISQSDPLADLFSQQFFSEQAGSAKGQKEKIEKSKGLFSLGLGLENSCEVERFYTYRDNWSEESARRSIVATLQYIGLDISARAIVEYAKAFKLPEGEFENIVNNLVVNTCSENITVFSKKLLKDNFMEMWEGDTHFKAPSFKGSPYVTKSNFERTESFEAKQREFEFAVKNFRDFCSWDGDVDNYRMLAPYLKNPYLMSIVFNNLMGKKIVWDKERESSALEDNDLAVRVACEDLICRKRDLPTFTRMFPRMVGSVNLKDDLQVLYCNHFRDTSLKTADVSPTIKKWINAQTLEEGKLLPMNIVSFATGVPDFFFSVDKYQDLVSMFSSTIEYRWDEWAKKQTDTLVLDLLFEESLFVDLAPQTQEEKSVGSLGLVFDFTLGELDREIEVVDKVTSTFYLEFPKSYLRWVKRAYISASNKSEYKKLEDLEKNFETYISVQLKEKEKFFDLNLWNESFAGIMAKELQERLVAYQGGALKGLDHGKVQVPVKFRFGLFALKYLRDKYKAKYQVKSVTNP